MKKNPQDKASSTFLPCYPSHIDNIRTLAKDLHAALSEADRTDWVTFDFLPGLAFPAAPLRDWVKIIAKAPQAISLARDVQLHKITVHDNDSVAPGRAEFLGTECPSKTISTEKDQPPYFRPAEHGTYGPGYLLTILTPATTAAPEAPKAKADPWILKAVSKDTARPQLARHYGNFATDGYRLHYDAALPGTECPIKWRYLLDPCKAYTEYATINTAALAKACKSVKRFSEYIHLTLNGSLQYAAHSEEYGDTTGEITRDYSHTGADLTVVPT